MSNHSRLKRLEQRALAIADALDEEAAIELSIQRFCGSYQTVCRRSPDGCCPDGWRPVDNGLCISPPMSAYDLERRGRYSVDVRWDPDTQEWVGDAYYDEALRLWVTK